MTLENTVQQKVSEWRPPGGRQSLTVRDEPSGWSVTLTADRCDELGCLLWELRLHRQSGAEGQTLGAWADGIARRVSGLLESLKVVEVDAERNEALLRSATPTEKGDKLFYYEVLLKNTTSALVRRYQANGDGNRRTQVAFALTYEALAKFAQDLSA